MLEIEKTEKLAPAATLLAEGSYHPSQRQGATQTGTEEVTKRFKKYAPYVFSSNMQGVPDSEFSDGVWQYRIKADLFDKASACGLPVIASKRGGIPEIVQDGKTGLLLNDPQDTAEMAQKLSYLIKSADKRESLGRAARKFMEERFSWDRTAKEIEDLYDRLLS